MPGLAMGKMFYLYKLHANIYITEMASDDGVL